jgi:cation transport regulator ChaC
MTGDHQSVWVFGYGSLIWGTGGVKPLERREGILPGWHREWTWISAARHGAPTCSLKPDGKVKGVFLRLNLMTSTQGLEQIRRRENRETEQTMTELPEVGAKTYFWTMGSNLDRFPEFNNLRDVASDHLKKVSAFDPEDPFTTAIVRYL